MSRPTHPNLSAVHQAAILTLVTAAHLALVWTALLKPVPVARIESGQPLVVYVLSPAMPVLATPRTSPPVPQPRPAKATTQRAALQVAPPPLPALEQAAADAVSESPREAVLSNEPALPVSGAAVASAVASPAPITMVAELAVACTERVAPSYPADARQRGEAGLVLVRVEIDERGWVTSAHVERSSGHAALDEAALRAVQAWRCTPPTRHGVPARGVALQPFNFSIAR